MIQHLQQSLQELEVGIDAFQADEYLFAAMLDFYDLSPESFEWISERNKIGLWKYFLQSQGAKLIDGL